MSAAGNRHQSKSVQITGSAMNAECPDLSRSERRRFRQGEVVYLADHPGRAWRVLSGSVRLDRCLGDTREFANLAVSGDIIGAETELFGRYTFSATAISSCLLAPWPEGDGELTRDTMLQVLIASERRAAELMNLRCGLAMDRLRRLLAMLIGGKGCDSLPGLRDLAEITDLRIETVSRSLRELRAAGEPGSDRVGYGRRTEHAAGGPALHGSISLR